MIFVHYTPDRAVRSTSIKQHEAFSFEGATRKENSPDIGRNVYFLTEKTANLRWQTPHQSAPLTASPQGEAFRNSYPIKSAFTRGEAFGIDKPENLCYNSVRLIDKGEIS